HPSESSWYSDRIVNLDWSSSSGGDYDGATSSISGIDGYSYSVDQVATTTPDMTKEVEEATTSISNYDVGADGTFYFHIRARDNSGNWGNTRHFKIQVDKNSPPIPGSALATGSGNNTVKFKFDRSIDPGATDGTKAGTKKYYIQRFLLGDDVPSGSGPSYDASYANVALVTLESDAITVDSLTDLEPSSTDSFTYDAGSDSYTFTDNELSYQKYYYYRVRAQDNSNPSNPASVSSASYGYAYGKTNSQPIISNFTVKDSLFNPLTSMDLGSTERTINVSVDVADVDNTTDARLEQQGSPSGTWITIEDGSNAIRNGAPGAPNLNDSADPSFNRTPIGTGEAGSPRGYRYTYSYIVPNTSPYGDYEVRVSASDIVGNSPTPQSSYID
ncbi:hypothetical protein LCGC14_2901700, partial [marine sediment metagenome]